MTATPLFVQLYFVFQIFSLAFSAKHSLFSGLFNGLSAANSAVFTKFGHNTVHVVDNSGNIQQAREGRKLGLPSLSDLVYMVDTVHTGIHNFEKLNSGDDDYDQHHEQK